MGVNFNGLVKIGHCLRWGIFLSFYNSAIGVGARDDRIQFNGLVIIAG